MKCCMHVVDSDGPITSFTNTSWEKFRSSVFLWKGLNCRESAVAEDAVQTFQLEESQDPTPVPNGIGYHRRCYQHFTNVTKIRRAQMREEKAVLFNNAVTEGKLLQAAEKNDDHTILLHIKDEDCVALGVQYHRSCYREYTRKKTTKVEEPTFDVSYKMFCERIIRQRLINNQEVMKMEQLQKIFTVMATSIEGLDASDYSEVKLKSRLRRDFHQLVFQTLKRCPSQLVFAESPTETETPMDTTQPSPAAEQPSQSGETTPSNSATEEKTVDLHTTPEETRTLYTAALLLKTLLSDAPPPQDVSVNEGLTVVPLELFNLVSWVIGASEEPTLEHTVNIPDDLHLKVLSVCQDIAYLASRDQKQSVCPWHLEDENLHVTLRTKPS
ncbi:uncharacterized protein LOC134440288 isoform X2 [Engraulis encrasicolus]|uniref:uncharacterized protein LOC134440288 isoform X2 n=1 Tax=Engraulis encrasicolus TaxID=184585 RepID=UPI002FD44C54